MKILLLGRNGQLGWELQRSLAPLGELVAPGRAERGDLSQIGELTDMAYESGAQVIVNAAAYTAVDRAQDPAEQDRCMDVNAGAPAALAMVARETGALLVHYSSDYVFDGSGHEPRDEEASPGADSVYGESKAAGDFSIETIGCAHLILRTSWVCGARGGNFAKTMLRLAQERDELKVVSDQVGAPTGAELLADVTAHMIRHTLVNPALSGLYNVVASGETSWHGYAHHVIERARAAGLPIRVAPEALRAIPTSDYPTPAVRPLNSRLSTEKLRRQFGLTLPHWTVGVNRMLDEVLSR
ncbi:MAG: dTDP-4-dehydrorhamnose reductase [Betaproteobacteria bacterium]